MVLLDIISIEFGNWKLDIISMEFGNWQHLLLKSRKDKLTIKQIQSKYIEFLY